MKKLQIMPLGGIGEFGMNCMGIRYGDEMIVVDAGMGFPEETVYGVDISIPDFEFLEEYRDDLLALVLTHGHEDHIGATPYFLKRFNLPVYGSRLTQAFVEDKLIEHELIDEVLLHRVEANDVVKLGSFEIEFIHASHSLVDCFSLAIKTPAGTLIHTGDYKIDESPVVGPPYDLKTLRRYGDEGVLALLGDSTNATVPGRTPSETDVIEDLEDIFEQADGRLFITTFSSSIHRLQVIFDIAETFGRRVCLLGRSMIRNAEIAEDLGFLEIPEGCRVGLSESRQLDDDEIAYLVTGSQAEPRAVLWNLATQSYKGLSITKGDTIVLSARIIPGNEKRISRMISAIYRSGGNTIEEKRRMIHVSGHASQEDIRIMTETARPRYVVPIHGEFRMLFRHKEFLRNHLGFDSENIVIIEDGDVLEFDEGEARVLESFEARRVFLNDSRSDEVDPETVRIRRKLAYDGVVTLTVTVDSGSRDLIKEPSITTHGVTGIDPLNGLMDLARETVRDAFEALPPGERSNRGVVEDRLSLSLRQFVKKHTGTKPLVVPNIIEI